MIGVEEESLTGRPAPGLSAFVLATAAAAAAVAATVLLGWALNLGAVPKFASGDSAMVPWSAAGCLLASIWVPVWWRFGAEGAARPVLIAIAALALAIGLVAMLENLSGVDSGLDALLWPGSVGEELQAHAGRPSLQTGIALAVLAAAELGIAAGWSRWNRTGAGLAACGVMAIGLLGLAGRALQITPTFNSDQLGSGGLSVPTALALALAGAALAAACLGPALLETASGSSAARRQVRVLLPTAIAIPLLVFIGAYASLELSGTVQVIGPVIAAAAVVSLVLGLRLVNLGVSEDAASHDEIERALGKRIALYGAVVESSDDAILTKNLDGTITGWNSAAERLYGYSAAEAIGHEVDLIVPEERREELHSTLRRLAAGERVESTETVRVRRDGTRFPASLTISPVFGETGEIVGASSIVRDISERIEAAAELAERTDELRQAQKMEAIGRLAGGVAHDFNNLLTVIASGAQLLELHDAGEEDRELLSEISAAAEQAAALTAQLLAFGRSSPADAERLDIDELLGGSASMLSRLIGSDIELALALDTGRAQVSADPNQLQQVLMNLVVNARDAMPTGGRLTIASEAVVLDEPPQGAPEVEPGPFVRVEVSDTGTGIEPEQVERIFEPFFSTKEVGKGTGLGLSTSHGIVSQLGGKLSVRSTLGEGTTFSILLPVAAAPDRPAAAKTKDRSDAGGNETILLADDQEALRRVISRVLRDAGYEVLVASDGEEAIDLARAQEGPIDLLLTDLVMPTMNGYELAEALTAESPSLKVLFMSGYASSARERYGKAADQPHLQKPFKPDGLRRAVREALDGNR